MPSISCILYHQRPSFPTRSRIPADFCHPYWDPLTCTVRNRASEIASLLGDVDRIRAERRKAKSNKNKYQGTGNEGGMSFATASGGRYGGFGSESLGYPGGGGGGSSSGGGGGEYGREDRYRGDRGGEREWGSRADGEFTPVRTLWGSDVSVVGVYGPSCWGGRVLSPREGAVPLWTQCGVIRGYQTVSGPPW